MDFLKKLINKHTLSLASNAVMPIMGMVSVSLLAHNLSEGDFGNWILFLITFTIANFFRAGFLQTSVVKFYAGAERPRQLNVVGSTWVVGFVLTSMLGFISLMVYLFFSKNGESAGIIAKWFGIIFFCTLPSAIALWILQAEERFDKVFILQLMGQGGFFIALIILIFLHKATFQVVIYGYCWSAMLTSILSIITGWCKIWAIPHKTAACIMQLVNFGKYSVGTSLSSYLLRGSDTFIIKIMFVNPAIVGVYYLPQRLMEVIEIPLRSFIATALPAMSAALQRNDEEYMTFIMKKYAGILTVLLIPVSIIAFLSADFVIGIIGGQKFVHSDAANVFRIFMSFAVLLPVDRFFGITLDILNKPHYNLIKVTLMLVVNVIGDFVGIYLTHNLYGVAASSIFTFLAGIIYGYWVLKRNLKFKIRDIFKLGIVETKLLTVALFSRLGAKSG
jgi:O-antigen/teichoic acid export membrane protein